MSLYYSIVYLYLQYAIICWGNTTKANKRKLQVKQNRIIKIICCQFSKKTRLQTLYDQLQVLNIDGIYKLEVSKFMAKAYRNDLPMLYNNHSFNFQLLSSIHSYSTRSSNANKFFVQRTRYAKTNQSLNVSGIKIWNDLPEDIKNRVSNASYKTLSKLLKNHFLGLNC